MATLGSLTLKLRSTRKALTLDLLQSRQELEQWQQSITPLLDLKARVKIDWDSFSDAESEIRRWVDNLPKPDVRVGAKFVGADLQANIEQLERLLANPLKILVDDSRLFELNEHFRLKEKDYRQLQSVLDSPLAIKVDRSQLDNLARDLRSIENTPQVNLRANVNLESLRAFHEQLNRYSQGRTLELATSVSRTTLNAIQNDLKSLASNLTTARVSVQIDSQLQALRSELSGLPDTRIQVGVDVDDRRLQQLENSIEFIDRPHRLKIDLPDTLNELVSSIAKLALSPISIPVKIAQNAISGVFEGFTREIGAGISDGLGTRKFARNQSRRAGNYAQTLDKEVFGIEDYSAAFLSELIDSGDIKKANQQAAPYLKANKHIDRVKRAIKLGDLKKNPELMTEYPELMQVIPEDMMPAFNELGAKKFIRKHGLRPQADGTSLLDKITSRADLLGQELMPTEVVGAVVNPALATAAPILNFINKMQVAMAVKYAKIAAPSVAATLPKLENGQDGYLNVIGGGQFREGRGHQELTAAFEGVIPSRRLLGITNPETDPGGKLQKNTIGSLVQSALKFVAPDLANDPEQSNNIANVLTLLNRSLNPKFRSTATTQSIANVLAAKQTGVDPSKVGTLSYSFGGADARDTALGLNMLGLGQSKATALAYPDVNAYKPDLPNFQAMMLKQDVMGIPKTQFGLGSMANQRVYSVDKLAFGGAAHAYKHYFKSPELVGDINNQLGLPAVGGDLSAALHHGSTLSQTLHADRQINSILDKKGYDKTAPYVRDGDITLSELYSRFMEGNKKQDVSKYGPDQRALAETSQAKFAKTEARIKADFLAKGVDPAILDKPGELKANIVLRGQAIGFNKAIEVFQTGIPQGEKQGYFAGNLDRDVVRSRIPDAHNAAAYFTKELDATAPSTALVIDGFKKLAAVMQEFADTGVLSKETKAALKKTDVEPNQYLDSLAFSKLDTSKLPTHEQLRTTDRNQTTLVNEELNYRDLAATYRDEAKAQSTTPIPVELPIYRDEKKVQDAVPIPVEVPTSNPLTTENRDTKQKNTERVPQLERPAVIDIQASPVTSRVKQTNASIINDMLMDRKLKIERAIEDGDLRLVKSHKQEFDSLIQDGRDLIESNPNSISLKSNFKAQLTNKDIFSRRVGVVTDLIANGASPSDIDRQPDLTEKIKKQAKLGLKAKLIDNTSNPESGLANIEALLGTAIAATAIPLVGAPVTIPAIVGGALITALKKSKFAQSPLGQTRIPGLDFLDNPVKSFRETIGLSQRESAYTQGMMLGGDGTTRYTPPPTRLQSLISSARDSVDRVITPARQYIQELPTNAKANFQSIADATQSFRENPAQEIRAGMVLVESQIRKKVSSLIDRVRSAIGDSNISEVVENFKENPLQTIRAGMILAESATRKKVQPSVSEPTSAPTPIAPTPPRLPNGITPPPPPRNPLINPAEPSEERNITLLDKLKTAGKLALGAFAGFTLASLGVPAMLGLAKATFDAAVNFERLQVKLAAASDSAATGRQKFASLSATADKLGISRSQALETGAFIGGTTFGSQLDGAPSDLITNQILKVAQARGLNKQETDGFNLAIAQTLGRNRTSAQEINQLTQSAGITDARAIAARGLGYTPAQFTAIQESPNGIDSKRFVQAFLAQAVQDSLSGQAVAENSIGFKQTKASALIERTQGNIGASFAPAAKAGLDLFNSSLGLLNTALEKSSGILIGFAIGGITAFLNGAVTAGTVLNSTLSMVGNSIKRLGSVAGAQAPKLASFAAQMGLMILAGEVWRQATKDIVNSSQDLLDAAKKIGAASEEANRKAGKPTKGKPQTTDEIEGKDFGESVKLFGQRAVKGAIVKQSEIGDAIVNSDIGVNIRNALGIKGDANTYRIPPNIDSKQKEADDRTIAADEMLNRSQGVIKKTPEAIKNADKITAIDIEMNRIDTERSGLFSSGNPDAGKLAALDNRYREKTAERGEIINKVTPQKTDLQEGINATKGAISTIKEQFQNNQIAEPDYISKLKLYEFNLKDLEEAQRKLNDAIKSGYDNLTPWVTTLAKISAKFEDIGIAANTTRERSAIIRNRAEIGGTITRGQAERLSTIENERVTEAEIKVRKSTVSELKASLNAKDPKNIENVQKAYSLIDASSSAQIKVALGNATSATDKITLEKLATVKDEQLKIASLDAGLSNSRTETYRKLYAENREAMLYYVNLAKQIDPVGTAFSKAILQVTQDKNSLLSKLDGFNNGIFDGFTNSIIEMFDAVKRRMEIAKTLANEKKNALDTRIDVGNQREGTRQNSININTSPAAAPNPATASSTPQGLNPQSQTSSSVPKRTKQTLNPEQPSATVKSVGRGTSATGIEAVASSNQAWVDRQEVAANTVYGQTIANAERNARTVLSEEDLKLIAANREAKRRTRQEIKQQNSEQRKQQQNVDNLSPAVTIQERQNRQLRDYDYTGMDKRDEISEKSISFNEKLADYRDVLIPSLKSYADGTNPALQKYSKEDRATFIPMYKQKLKEAQQLLTELEKGARFYGNLLTSYEKRLAQGRAKIQDELKYERDVAAENVKLGENDVKRGQIDSERQGVGQQLKTQQFNTELQGQDRRLEEESSINSIDSDKIRSLRQLEDRKRKGEFAIGRTPTQADKYYTGLKAKVEATAQTKLKSTKENRSQRSINDQFLLDNEKIGFDASKSAQESTGFDIASRNQAALDRTDAPFANNISIDRSYQKKLQDLETEKIGIEKTIVEKRKKYLNNPELLGRAEAEYAESLKQVEQKISTTRIEKSTDTADRERSKRGNDYTQTANIYKGDLDYYSAQTQALKYKGADTRDEDYILAISTKQQEYKGKRFDLEQQKSQISGSTEAAAQQREKIDALINSLNRLEKVELNNLATQFDRVNTLIGETQKATREVFGEFMRTGSFDLFKILRAPLDSALNQILDKVVPDLFSGLYQQPSKDGKNLPQVPSSFGAGLSLLGSQVFAPPAPLDIGLNSSIFDQLFQSQAQKQQSSGGGLLDGLLGLLGGGGGKKGGGGLLGFLVGNLGIPGFATGGMVTSPTLALVGEGINNEAIVPLPNGRSIPVDLRGAGESSGGSGAISNAISVTIQNNGQAKETSRGDANAIANLVRNLVTEGLINECRPGGLLS